MPGLRRLALLAGLSAAGTSAVLALLAVLAVTIAPATTAAASVPVPATSSDRGDHSGSPRSAASDSSAASDATPVQRAWAWLVGQSRSQRAATSASVITAARDYPADWTGAVSGTFELRGVPASTVTRRSAVVVDSPATVPSGFAGTVTGHVRVRPQQGRWIVQAYRTTGDGTVSVPIQASVAANGTFSINLGSVSDPPAGSWALGLLDADNAWVPTGTMWPSAPVYAGLRVRAYVVTDRAYYTGSVAARADGTFRFPQSRPGTKMFRLVDASGAVLAAYAPDLGLVRSYAGSTRTYTYDQALALITAVALRKDAAASRFTAGLLSLQLPDGGFVDSADSRNPADGIAVQRTGVTAVAVYALLRRLQTLDSSDPTYADVRSAATSGLAWLTARRTSSGLLDAGVGDYAADGSVDQLALPGWISTEHNLDAWQALQLAGSVLSDAHLTTAAHRLAAAISSRLWDAGAGRFLQGIGPDGTPDTTDPLDVSSWGALFLQATGAPRAGTALEHALSFSSHADGVTAFRAYYPQRAFPSAPDNVWIEGSAGVAVAQQRAGEHAAAAATLRTLAGLQRPDGALPYALVDNTATSMTTKSSVAATAWFILASTPGSIWARPTASR